MLALKDPITLREALEQGTRELRAADVPSPSLAAELLLMHVTGKPRAWLYAHPEDPLDAVAADRYGELIERRAAGAPTQYLTGHQEFWGLDLEVTPAVLIPRPETEHVVEVALARLGPSFHGKSAPRPLRIVDVGTGSGCLAIALAHELACSRVFATDISSRALEIARRNAVRHRVLDRVALVEANLLAAFAPRVFDLIVSNPPYIGRKEAASLPREVLEHEPPAALFGGEEGIEVYPLLIAQAAERLVSGGLLVLEIGYGVSERVEALLDAPDWREIEITNDLAGIPRVIAARRA